MARNESKEQKNKFPVSKLRWLWMNMKGTRAMFVLALFGTVVYNVMQLTVPFFRPELWTSICRARMRLTIVRPICTDSMCFLLVW